MADYILDLRKIVGGRPLLQAGAGVIVVDELRFFDTDSLPDNISPPSRKPLAQWLAAEKR